MNFKPFRNLVAIAAVVLVTGCATTTEIKALQPAEVGEAASLRTIGVTPFAQKSDRKVSLDAKIQSELANYQLEPGQNYYKVVDRANLESIISEQKMQLDGLTDKTHAAKIGKLSGAEALVVGNVSSAGVEDREYRENRVRYINCDKKGKNCTKQKYSVSCTARTVTVGAQVNLTHVERGEFITSNNYNQNKTWKTCEDGGSSDIGEDITAIKCLFGNCSESEKVKFPSADQGLELLADEIAAGFVFRLVPHYITFKVALYKKAEVELDKPKTEEFKSGLDFIKAGRIDRAEEFFVGLMDATQNKSFAISYNLGVIREAQGDFDAAKDLYQAADKLTLSPEKNINSALKRINQLISDRDTALEQIGKQKAKN